MTVTIGRRELLVAIGGTAAWPLVARAQQPAMPVIGILSRLAQTDLGLVIPGFHEGPMGRDLSRDAISRSSTAERRATTSACRRWQTIWSSNRLP
jgi:hypothetical protein